MLLSPRYFLHSSCIHKLSSLFSSQSIHLTSKQVFIILVFKTPTPPKSFGLIKISHFTIWYLRFLFVPCQKKNSFELNQALDGSHHKANIPPLYTSVYWTSRSSAEELFHLRTEYHISRFQGVICLYLPQNLAEL